MCPESGKKVVPSNEWVALFKTVHWENVLFLLDSTLWIYIFYQIYVKEGSRHHQPRPTTLDASLVN